MPIRFALLSGALLLMAVLSVVPMAFMPMNVTVDVGPKIACNIASLTFLIGSVLSAWRYAHLTRRPQ